MKDFGVFLKKASDAMWKIYRVLSQKIKHMMSGQIELEFLHLNVLGILEGDSLY